MSRKPRPAPRPIETPWMTPGETCLYLRWVDAEGKPNLQQFYTARSSHGLPASKAAGALRCHKQFIDEWVKTGVAVPDLPSKPRKGRLKPEPSTTEDALCDLDRATQATQFVSR